MHHINTGLSFLVCDCWNLGIDRDEDSELVD